MDNNSNSYMRKFIMMDNNAISHLQNKWSDAKGYVKIESRGVKGKISLNVEGLKKPIHPDRIYKGYLISRTGRKLVEVEIGTILINEKGKGSIKWEFNSKSVKNTRIVIQDFNVVLVRLTSIDSKVQDISIPLSAYIYKEDGSVNEIVKELEAKYKGTRRLQEKPKPKPKPAKIVENKSRKETKIEPQRKSQEEPKIEPQKKSQEEQKKEPEKEIRKEIPQIKKEPKKEIKKEIPQPKKEIKKESKKESKKEPKEEIKNESNNEQNITSESVYREIKKEKLVKNNTTDYGHPVHRKYNYTDYVRNHSKQLADYSMNILKFFKKVNPFDEEDEEYTWWEIEYDEQNAYRGFLPYHNYIVNVYYPHPFMNRITTCQSLMKKHKHYIFGIFEEKKEIKYYIYGVPGRFTREEQPYRGMTGFKTWAEKKNENIKENKLGYWFMYIDATTGKIIDRTE